MRFPYRLKMLFAQALIAVGMMLSPSAAVWADVVPPTDTSAAGELAFWNTIKKSETAADFEVYLKAFPDGMFVDVAKSRYQALGGQAVEPVEIAPVAPPVVKEAVLPEQPTVKKSANAVAKPAAKKKQATVFSKAKKAKKILAYSKARSKAKRATEVQYRPVKKAKRTKVVKSQYVKAKTAPKTYKKKPAVVKPYTPSVEAGGGGGGSGGGGGAGGGGGGWN